MAFLSRCFGCFGSTADNQIAKSSINILKPKPSLKIATLAKGNKYPEEMETPATGANTKKHDESAPKEPETSLLRTSTNLSNGLERTTTAKGLAPALDLSRLSFLKQDSALTDEQRYRHSKMKQLEMRVIESNILTVGSKFIIDGFCNINHTQTSIKKNKVCLGSELDAIQRQCNDIPVEKKTPEVFLEITYEMNLGAFFMVDLAKGSGTFIKIIKNHKVSHGAAISIGSSSIILRKGQEEDHHLELEFVDGQLKGRKEVFKPTDKKSKFKLGAAADCDISFKEYGLSRLQTTFEYKEGEWYIHDKDGISESSNGTWQLLDKPLLLTRDLVLKLGSTLFDIKLKDVESPGLNGSEQTPLSR